MDIISHGAHGFILAKVLTVIAGVAYTWPIAILFVFLGMAPDIIGWLEKVKVRFFPKEGQQYITTDNSNWSWYLWAHDTYNMWFSMAWPWTVHICLDALTHEKGKRWWVKGERLHWWYINLVITAILLALIII